MNINYNREEFDGWTELWSMEPEWIDKATTSTPDNNGEDDDRI